MAKKRKTKINIGNVTGNVVMSQNQKGGITKNESDKEIKKQKNSFFNNKYVLLIGFLGTILGILGYFGFQPSTTRDPNVTKEKIQKIDTFSNKPISPKNDTITPKKITMSKKKNKAEEGKPITIGDVTGDIIISQNQTGGITAKNVNINVNEEPIINQALSEEITDLLKVTNCQIIIKALGSDGKTNKIASQLYLASKNSGNITKGISYEFNPGLNFSGIDIFISESNPLEELAFSLKKLLTKASIKTRIIYHHEQEIGYITLFVGYL